MINKRAESVLSRHLHVAPIFAWGLGRKRDASGVRRSSATARCTRGCTCANVGTLGWLRALAKRAQYCGSICAPEPLQGCRRVRTGAGVGLAIRFRLCRLDGRFADDAPSQFKEALAVLLQERQELSLGRFNALVDVGLVRLEVRFEVRLVDVTRTL